MEGFDRGCKTTAVFFMASWRTLYDFCVMLRRPVWCTELLSLFDSFTTAEPWLSACRFQIHCCKATAERLKTCALLCCLCLLTSSTVCVCSFRNDKGAKLRKKITKSCFKTFHNIINRWCWKPVLAGCDPWSFRHRTATTNSKTLRLRKPICLEPK